jgi:hypothetical protein
MQSSDAARIVRTWMPQLNPSAVWRSFLDQLATQCSNGNCPSRHRLWPSWSRKSNGIEFDGKWSCSSACAQSAISQKVGSLLTTFVTEAPRSYRFPLGLLLVKEGLLSPQQLRRALDLQREQKHLRLGDLLLEVGFVTELQLIQALSKQWGFPVFPLERLGKNWNPKSSVPFPLLQSAFAVPVHLAPEVNTLHIAFGNYVDHTLLYGIEQILGCRTIACTSSKHAVNKGLDNLRENPDRTDTCFDSILSQSEIVSVIGNYAQELRASHIQLARAASFLWVRFRRAHSSRDLLFRAMPDQVRSASQPLTPKSQPHDRTQYLSASAYGF